MQKLAQLQNAARIVIESDAASLPQALEQLREVLESQRPQGRPRRLDYGKILELYAAGKSRAEIAGELGYKEGSVSSAISRLGPAMESRDDHADRQVGDNREWLSSEQSADHRTGDQGRSTRLPPPAPPS